MLTLHTGKPVSKAADVMGSLAPTMAKNSNMQVVTDAKTAKIDQISNSAKSVDPNPLFKSADNAIQSSFAANLSRKDER